MIFSTRSPAILLLSLVVTASKLTAQQPVAFYPFNGNAEDATGNGHNGTVYGATLTLDRFGNCESAYAFNGTEHDYIRIPHHSALSFGRHDFTINSWVKFCKSQPEYAGIVCKGPAVNPYPGYQLHIASGSTFTTQIGDDGNWSDERRAAGELNDGQWHMVTVSVSPKINAITLYIDGVEVNTWQQYYERRGDLNVSRYDPTPLFIGTERNRDRFFTGVIDDVALYNRLLNESEIEALFHENGWTKDMPAPEPYITVNIDPCNREKATLSVGCYPFVHWSTGERTESITLYRSGKYSALVSDGSGCPEQSVSVAIKVDRCDDLKETEKNDGVSGTTANHNLPASGLAIHLYPNPAANDLQVSVELPFSSPIRLELLDLQGRSLGIRLDRDLDPGSHLFKLPIDKLSTGTYLLRVSSDEETHIKQIVVQH